MMKGDTRGLESCRTRLKRKGSMGRPIVSSEDFFISAVRTSWPVAGEQSVPIVAYRTVSPVLVPDHAQQFASYGSREPQGAPIIS